MAFRKKLARRPRHVSPEEIGLEAQAWYSGRNCPGVSGMALRKKQSGQCQRDSAHSGYGYLFL